MCRVEVEAATEAMEELREVRRLWSRRLKIDGRDDKRTTAEEILTYAA